MKLSFFMILLMLSSVFSQTPAPSEALKQEAALNSARADLEAARQKRDQAVAVRWQEKKQAMDFREAFNSKYTEARDRLDVVASEKARILEELRATKSDMEQYQNDVQKARAEFMVLSAQDDKVESLQRVLSGSLPFGVTERLERLNGMKSSLDLKKDNPSAVVDLLLSGVLLELQFTRDIVTQKSELIFEGGEIGYGFKTRLGGVGGLQYDPDSKKSAVLLATQGEKDRLFVWQSNLSEAEVRQVAAVYGAAPSSDTALVNIPLDILLSTSLSSEIASQKDLNWKEQFAKFLKDGGLLMYPILALFLLAFLFALERVVYITMRNRTSKRAVKAIYALCEKEDYKQAAEKAEKLKGAVGDIVKAVLSRKDKGRNSAEKAVQEVMAHEVPALDKRLSTISVMGSAAPLLGLLGTVFGMIQLFDVITMHGTSDPKLLAGGISVALVTTQTGLAVAIPVQLIHNFVANKVDRLVAELDKQALRFLNSLWMDS